MAVTPEFLAQQIQNREDASAVFDRYLLPKEGESAEDFQQRTRPIIAQTMALVGKDSTSPFVAMDPANQTKRKAIQEYTRRLAIQAQLELEEKQGIDNTHKNFQELRDGCSFTLNQIKSKHSEIEENINKEAVEEMRLEFVDKLLKIPLAKLQRYEKIRNEFSDLVDKTHKGSLTIEESNKTVELKATQREFEQDYPEIRYRLLLGQAGSQTFKPKHPPFLFSAEKDSCTNLAENDMQFSTIQVPSAKSDSFAAGHNVIGSFFTSAAKITKQILSKPVPNEDQKIHSNAFLPKMPIPFFAKPIAARDPQTEGHTLPFEYDYPLQIALLGDPGVGTSNLRHRFAKDIYPNQHIQCLSDTYVFEVKTIASDKLRVKLHIWTAKAQSKTKAIDFNESPLRYYTSPARKHDRSKQVQERVRRAKATIIAFDVTDHNSFANLAQWLREIDRYSNYTLHTLAATKCDIPEKDWAVKKDEIRTFAEENSLNVFFTSAKDNFNVDELFESIIDLIIQERQNERNEGSIQVTSPI